MLQGRMAPLGPATQGVLLRDRSLCADGLSRESMGEHRLAAIYSAVILIIITRPDVDLLHVSRSSGSCAFASYRLVCLDLAQARTNMSSGAGFNDDAVSNRLRATCCPMKRSVYRLSNPTSPSPKTPSTAAIINVWQPC
jgi:hypothetical protein